MNLTSINTIRDNKVSKDISLKLIGAAYLARRSYRRGMYDLAAQLQASAYDQKHGTDFRKQYEARKLINANKAMAKYLGLDRPTRNTVTGRYI